MEYRGPHPGDSLQKWEIGLIAPSSAGEREELVDLAALHLNVPDMSESLFSSVSGATNLSCDDDPSRASSAEPPSYNSTQITVVELLSTSATSSAFPEAFGLSVSTQGRWIVAYSSSALYILSVQHLPAIQNSCRAFRIRRKPLAVAVTDVGRFAVLTTSHKIDVYHCGEEQGDLLAGKCEKLETVYLNCEARTVAFSHCGEVVAAGSDNGIEIRNMSEGRLETDKRQINCAPVQYLAFSEDGKSLLATASARRSRLSTFISVNSAYEDALLEDNPIQDPLGKVWITQLLFPERISAKQAVFLPSPPGRSVNEVLAFDSQTDRYRVYDVARNRFSHQKVDPPEDVRWGRSERLEDALPAISCNGSHAALAVRLNGSKEVWAYHLPSEWRDRATDGNMEAQTNVDEDNVWPFQRIRLPSKEEGTSPESITCLRWMQLLGAPVERLVVLISTVTLSMPEDVVPSAAPAASGKIMLFDYQHTAPESEGDMSKTVTVDLDEVPLMEGLADDELEMDREVDLVRRRTQVQRQRPELSSRHSPTDRVPRRSVSSGSTSTLASVRELSDANRARSARRRRSLSSTSSLGDEAEIGLPMGAVDEPYSQSQPRSQFSLNRAATIAASAQSNRAHLRALPSRPLEYRRADGLREMPHESDADNWVPPPPPYSAEPDHSISLPVSSCSRAATSYIPQAYAQSLLNRNSMARSSPSSAAMTSHSSRPLPSTRSQTAPAPNPEQIHRPLSVESPASIASYQVSLTNRDNMASVPQYTFHAPFTVSRRPVGAAQTIRSTPAGPPMPGHLVSPLTFPGGVHSPRGSTANHHVSRQQYLAERGSRSTPSSPMRDADGRESPSPVPSPPSDQVTFLHRRSGSGGAIPRAARGAIGSCELDRPLPPVPRNQRLPAGAHPQSSAASRRNLGSDLNRLETIASNAISESHHQIFLGAQTRPETPTERRQRRRDRDSPQEILNTTDTTQAMARPSGHRSQTATSAGSPKESSKMKCLVM